MKTSHKTLQFLAIALLAGIAGAAQAQVLIFSDNFDELTIGTNLAAWSGGSIANNTVTAQADGVGGSLGIQWQVDFLQSYNGYQAYQWQDGNVTGNTSPNPGDYTLSFDLDVVGPSALNNLQVNVQAANSWSGPWGGTGAAGVAVNPTLGWQHVSLALNNPVWTANGLTPQGSIWQVQFQLNGWQLAGGGPATGEQVVLDNLSLSMVPEPASIALLGLGLTAGIASLRRRHN
jgi:hypothetical protein